MNLCSVVRSTAFFTDTFFEEGGGMGGGSGSHVNK